MLGKHEDERAGMPELRPTALFSSSSFVARNFGKDFQGGKQMRQVKSSPDLYLHTPLCEPCYAPPLRSRGWRRIPPAWGGGALPSNVCFKAVRN